MTDKVSSIITVVALCAALGAMIIVGRNLHAELTQLKSAYNAMLKADGDGSCSVVNNGPKILCWMENGALRTDIYPEIPPKPKAKKLRKRSATAERG